MRNPLAGGAGSAARVDVALPHSGAERRRRALERLLENERLLAFALLTPTVVLLGASSSWSIATAFLRGAGTLLVDLCKRHDTAGI